MRPTTRAGDLAAKHERFCLTRDERLRNELVESYAGFAKALATRFDTGRDSPEDLGQAALLGLVNAVDRFDPARGVQFTTYAWATITGELKRHLRDRTWRLRVPRRLQELSQQIARASDELAQELGRRPSMLELQERTGLTEHEIRGATQARSADRMVSLDVCPERDDEWTVQLGAEEAGFAEVDERREVAQLLKELSERDRTILRLRFVEDMTQEEIGDQVGLSQMQVSRLLAQILDRLRATAGVAPGRPALSAAR